jgi:hypothetical protein
LLWQGLVCRAQVGQPPVAVPTRLVWQTVCAQRGEAHPEQCPTCGQLLVGRAVIPRGGAPPAGAVDIIVVGTTAAALAAKHATSTIPIVMTGTGDPVGDGLVDSLAQPGGNITGLSFMVPDLTGKRLELLKEAVPGLARVALLLDAGHPRRHAQRHDHEAAARVLGVQLLPLEVRGPDEFVTAFQAATQAQARAFLAAHP